MRVAPVTHDRMDEAMVAPARDRAAAPAPMTPPSHGPHSHDLLRACDVRDAPRATHAASARVPLRHLRRGVAAAAALP